MSAPPHSSSPQQVQERCTAHQPPHQYCVVKAITTQLAQERSSLTLSKSSQPASADGCSAAVQKRARSGRTRGGLETFGKGCTQRGSNTSNQGPHSRNSHLAQVVQRLAKTTCSVDAFQFVVIVPFNKLTKPIFSGRTSIFVCRLNKEICDTL